MIRLVTARVIINTNYFIISFLRKYLIKLEPTKPAPPVTMIKFFIKSE